MSSYAMRNGAGGHSQAVPAQTAQTQYSQSIAKSMTIDEMRQLHHRALSEAEAKKTELRLVLASRYRELVGSSDEVLKMRERSEELHQLVSALPSLMTKLEQSTKLQDSDAPSEPAESKSTETEDRSLVLLRRDLSRLPRVVHRALDKHDVHRAATSLIQLFSLIASQTDQYPLANALAVSGTISTNGVVDDPMLNAQIKMTLLHVQTLPDKTIRLAKRVLLRAAAYGKQEQNSHLGAQRSAAALSSLDLLDVTQTLSNTLPQDRAVKMIDLYFDSKAKLLHTLLNQLTMEKSPTAPKPENNNDTSRSEMATETASTAEEILSKIVLILQYDVIVHPYQVFILRNFPSSNQTSTVESIMSSLPTFDPDLLKSKASHFLAANLPLIRTKVKSVLVTIAGTTASALGQIRQSLYDKTDGIECMERLDGNGVCTWEEAVNGMVDVRIVLSHGSSFAPATVDEVKTGTGARAGFGTQQRKFSLWGALFSNIFSSLVHSLLTSSFHSVHARVVSTLRTSLVNAPPLDAILPHEAYRNTLRIATELDAALLKVSDDAHELLVHAEERVESERRLRQSLYVQTCEIMGRLLSELRRMLQTMSAHRDASSSDEQHSTDATKELIVGRLCHLLKFRLTSLPTLLDSNKSPAVLHAVAGTSSGMITLLDLQSAFDLADDNDDGLITFEEAMEAVDSAFSGTQFRGAEMVRETLLLTSSSENDSAASPGGPSTSPRNVTLHELTLLSARGLRHEASGPTSALGTIQQSLDDIVESCFTVWAKVALQKSTESFVGGLTEFIDMACTTSEVEWKRIHDPAESSETNSMFLELGEALHDDAVQDGSDKEISSPPIIGNVSPYIVGYLLSVSSVLNRSTCPSDSLMPVPSADYASALGIPCKNQDCVPNMMEKIRWALLRQALHSAAKSLDKHVMPAIAVKELDRDGDARKDIKLNNSGPSALIQLAMDFSFLKLCFIERNKYGFDWNEDQNETEGTVGERVEASKVLLESVTSATDGVMGNRVDLDMVSLFQSIDGRHRHVLEVCDLFFSSLFGEDTKSVVPSVLGDGAEDVNFASASGSTSAPLLLNPLPSSRRFVLLPVQSDRSLNELQLRGKYRRDKNEEEKGDHESFGVVSSGLGFFSSILSKK